jgi:hypothetical protein
MPADRQSLAEGQEIYCKTKEKQIAPAYFSSTSFHSIVCVYLLAFVSYFVLTCDCEFPPLQRFSLCVSSFNNHT